MTHGTLLAFVRSLHQLAYDAAMQVLASRIVSAYAAARLGYEGGVLRPSLLASCIAWGAQIELDSMHRRPRSNLTEGRCIVDQGYSEATGRPKVDAMSTQVKPVDSAPTQRRRRPTTPR